MVEMALGMVWGFILGTTVAVICLKRDKEADKEGKKFIEIRATYTPDELVTYPEYKGKPYYSIVYEENGELFCGFGTYKIEVLSEYLRRYFLISETGGRE